MPQVAVVILNWNGKSILEQFLPSVINHSKNADVYVADNASTDDSLNFLSKEYPQVKVISLKENFGFSGGYNLALEKIEADYFILLNSDVEVTDNWIKPVITMMEADKTIAAAQPKIKWQRDKEFFEYAGATGGFIDKNAYVFCRGRIFNSFEKDEGQYNQTSEIFWASGAAMFVRASVYKKMGGLDVDFFAHMEEIDLCWRIKNCGEKIMYCPHSTVYHVGGATLNANSPRKTFLNFRNNLFLILKNYRSGSLFLLIIKRLILDGVAGLKFIQEGKFSFMLAILKAHLQFYQKFPYFLAKRNELKKTWAPVPNNKGLFNGSILFHFFFMNQKKYTNLPRNKFN